MNTIDSVNGVYKVLETALAKFGEEGLAFSFNGGKDCTVLLPFYCTAILNYRRHLSRSAEQRGSAEHDHGNNGSAEHMNGMKDWAMVPEHDSEGKLKAVCSVPKTEPKIKAIYFFLPNPFPEVESFITAAVESFNLDLTKIPSNNMKAGMEEYLKQVPNVKAVVAGTRRTDPFSAHLTTFCPTDNGWPALTRINPILDWSYQDVWNVMLAYKFPYCCLYDKGYTSLGSRDNTAPNPTLQAGEVFLPAFKLQDGDQERAGRARK